MADTAHAKTDEKLEEMEKRLSAIYSRSWKLPTTKQTSIIYNSSNGKYYLWRYDNGLRRNFNCE